MIAISPLIYILLSPLFGNASESTIWKLFEMRQIPLARNSLFVGIGTGTACLFIGAALAFFIARTDVIGRKWIGCVFFLPVLIPPYIHAIVWSYLSGFLKNYLGFDLHSVPGVIFVMTLAYFPFVTLTTLAGLRSIDRDQEEVALLTGSRSRMIRFVTLPLCLPHILAGAVFAFVFAIINVGIPDILRVNVYPLDIFIQFSAFSDPWSATVLALPMVTITVLLILTQHRLMGRRAYLQIGGGCGKQNVFSLGKLRGISSLFCFGLLFLSVAVPFSVMLYKAGPFDTYVRVISTSFENIAMSFSLAVFSAFLSVVLGVFLGYLQYRLGRKSASWLSLLVVIPFAVPATATGIGLIGLWNRPLLDWVYTSFGMIIIAQTARFASYSGVIMAAGMSRIPLYLEEASLVAGRTFLITFRRIVMPLLKPYLFLGFFIVFILSFGELGTTLLISPPGVETLPVKVYNLMHYGAEEMVAALSIILMLMIAGISFLFLRLHRYFGIVE